MQARLSTKSVMREEPAGREWRRTEARIGEDRVARGQGRAAARRPEPLKKGVCAVMPAASAAVVKSEQVKFCRPVSGTTPVSELSRALAGGNLGKVNAQLLHEAIVRTRAGGRGTPQGVATARQLAKATDEELEAWRRKAVTMAGSGGRMTSLQNLKRVRDALREVWMGD